MNICQVQDSSGLNESRLCTSDAVIASEKRRGSLFNVADVPNTCEALLRIEKGERDEYISAFSSNVVNGALSRSRCFLHEQAQITPSAVAEVPIRSLRSGGSPCHTARRQSVPKSQMLCDVFIHTERKNHNEVTKPFEMASSIANFENESLHFPREFGMNLSV